MNPIFIDLGIITIRWYTIFILIGMFLGGMLVLKEAKKWNFKEDFILNLFFYTIIFSLIGARLYYVVFSWDYYKNDIISIFKIWEGGLAIHGGLLFGLLTIIIYSRKYKVKLVQLLDIVAPGVLLGQAIGRWGNFFNSEAYGTATTYEALKKLLIPEFIINGMEINGVYYHPMFLYESILCIIGLIVILIIRKRKYLRIGQITGFYFMWYGFIRFFIEIMRTDSLYIGNLKIAQLVSILMFVFGLLFMISRKSTSHFENIYNDESNKANINF